MRYQNISYIFENKNGNLIRFCINPIDNLGYVYENDFIISQNEYDKYKLNLKDKNLFVLFFKKEVYDGRNWPFEDDGIITEFNWNKKKF